MIVGAEKDYDIGEWAKRVPASGTFRVALDNFQLHPFFINPPKLYHAYRRSGDDCRQRKRRMRLATPSLQHINRMKV